MAQDAIVHLVTSVQQSTSSQSLADVLRQIKNSLVGHVQRKEVAVRAGLVVPLLAIISAESPINDAAPTLHHNNRLQATVILSSIAVGGYQFVLPLLHAKAPDVLLSCLTSSDDALVTACLQCLRNLAASHASALPQYTGGNDPLGIITPETITVYGGILQKARSTCSDKQIELICELITLLAGCGNNQAVLADSDMIDTLSSLLASCPLPNPDTRIPDNAAKQFGLLRPSTVPGILSAIRATIAGSAYRAYRFVYSPAVKKICVSLSTGERIISLSVGGIRSFAPVPQVNTPALKTVSFGTTPNAYGASHGHDQHLSDAEHVNAVLDWLLSWARNSRGSSRLAALHLIAVVNGSIEEAATATLTALNVQKTRERERQLAFLAVPLATRLVQDALDLKPDSEQQPEDRIVKEQACEVLHELIRHSKDLQLAAADGGAIKSVCTTLRKSFQSLPVEKTLWSPRVDIPESDDLTTRLDDRGNSPDVVHIMRRRLGALHALASLAGKEDTHRKLIVDANVIPYVNEGLKTLRAKDGSGRQMEGNTVDVTIAACRAAQSISRSVAILRTSLIDAGIAKPILGLLDHPVLDVQIAATDVCTNLVLEFSPMREPLIELGVVQTLCRHAKTGSAALRLSSLWAFKHLMFQGDIEFKYDVLEQLDPAWILQVAKGDYDESQSGLQGGGVALSSANAAGEQIDLLNPTGMDLDNPESDDEDGNEDGELLYDESSKTHYQASSMRSTLHPQARFNVKRQLAIIKNAEQNASLQAKRDDIAIQEQALDFLRNTIYGPECATIIDHIFTKLRSQDVFDVLVAKISTISGSRSGRTVYHSTELILAALHLLVHLANGNANHKEMLIKHPSLLETLLPHFSHPNSHVRVTAVWIINSLTWTENGNDQTAARGRVRGLKQAGIESAIRRLANDPDLDVRERVKTAIRQFDEL